MFDFREIEKLVQLVDASDIGELEVSRLWSRVKIRKRVAEARVQAVDPPVVFAGPMAQPPVDTPADTTETAPEAPSPAAADEAELVAIRSPMVGTFYTAASPGADPFTAVGQIVKVGQVVCIIEAMKLMNQIESEVDGRVTKVTVENGQAVQFDQVLFLVRPGAV
jgi:acetyl-CoA carboxylase biotin carboxyl carrier protein